MMTIKQMSELTGVSARTLRYYDQIGLFCPTEKSKAGYRLYDEDALEKIQQILYFREIDLPLNTIKEIIQNPDLDKKYILNMQKEMLEAEKKRLERLIESIDAALKGEKMDFTIFSREESSKLFEAMLENMPNEMKNTAIEEFGTVENWREHYLDAVGSKKVQKQYAKMVEWYGSKEAYADAVKHPLSKELRESYQKRIDHILEKLSKKRELDVNCFEIRELIAEYGFVMKQFLQLKSENGIMLSQAQLYGEDERVKEATDREYGEGFSDYLNKAMIAFYGRESENPA